MGWDGAGNFVRGDGTRTGSDVWTQARNASVKINASDHDTHDEALATGLENCITRDGQNSPSANLPMATYKHTNVAVSAARTDYARTDQVQDGAFMWGGTTTGSSNAYALNLSPAITGYATGMRIAFIANHASTAASTLAVNGLTAKALEKGTGSAVNADDIQIGCVYEAVYTGTKFILTGSSIAINNQFVGTTKSPTWAGITDTGTLTMSAETASQPLYLDASKHIKSQAATTWYGNVSPVATWSPTVTWSSSHMGDGTPGVYYADYMRFGSLIVFQTKFDFIGGENKNYVRFTLPVAAKGYSGNGAQSFSGSGSSGGTLNVAATCTVDSGGTYADMYRGTWSTNVWTTATWVFTAGGVYIAA